MTAPTVRQAKILRTHELMQAMMREPLTILQIAELMSVHVRNAYRYMRLIEQLGIDVKTIDKPGFKKMYFLKQCPCCGQKK